MKETTRNIPVKKIISYSIIAICLFLCLSIFIEVIRANNEDRPPSICGVSVSYVPTGSMEGTINIGDYVAFKRSSFDEVNVNDIIVYHAKDGKYIIHRVIEKYESYLITKGDANPVADSTPITPDMVYGKYLVTLSFLNFMSGGVTKNGIFVTVLIIFFILLILQVASTAIKMKKYQVEKRTQEEKDKMLAQLKEEVKQEELEKLQNEMNHKE